MSLGVLSGLGVRSAADSESPSAAAAAAAVVVMPIGVC